MKIKKPKKSLALYDATELRPEKEGVYKPFVKQDFPVPDKPFLLLLKITVIMDIMFNTMIESENDEDISNR